MDELKNIYDKMYRAMIAKDTHTLGTLLDDSFVLVHMTGMRQSKTDFINAIHKGILNYDSCEDSEITTNEFGSTANIIGKSHVNASVFGGGRHTWPLQLDIDLIKRDNNWKIKQIKASTY